MLLGLVAALAAAVVYGAAAVVQAVGARQVASSRRLDPRVLLVLIRRPAYVLAIVMVLVGFLLHLYSLRELPLYLAQSAIAASLAVTAVLAVTVYGERLGRQERAAVAAVVVGLALLSAGGGTVGTVTAGDWLQRGLVAAVALVAVAGAVAARVPTRAGTASLGLLAGLGYAVVGVAGRVLPSTGLAGSPITYIVVVAGVLAFLLYSLALQRGAVTTVTGPMIVVQTALPSLVGVLLLGDQVRPGWGPVAVCGFLVAAAGTLALIRFEDAGSALTDPAAPQDRLR